MDKFLLIWKTLLGLIPIVLEIVKAVKVPGNGPTKFSTVMDLTIAGFDALPDDVKKLIPIDTIKGFLAKAINAAVAFYNLVGVFKKSPV